MSIFCVSALQALAEVIFYTQALRPVLTDDGFSGLPIFLDGLCN
jgi:hypothetical protein